MMMAKDDAKLALEDILQIVEDLGDQIPKQGSWVIVHDDKGKAFWVVLEGANWTAYEIDYVTASGVPSLTVFDPIERRPI